MKDQKITKKIINYIDIVLKYTINISYDEFEKNSMMVEACIFNLCQVGELVNRLDVEYMTKYPRCSMV